MKREERIKRKRGKGKMKEDAGSRGGKREGGNREGDEGEKIGKKQGRRAGEEKTRSTQNVKEMPP